MTQNSEVLLSLIIQCKAKTFQLSFVIFVIKVNWQSFILANK